MIKQLFEYLLTFPVGKDSFKPYIAVFTGQSKSKHVYAAFDMKNREHSTYGFLRRKTSNCR